MATLLEKEQGHFRPPPISILPIFMQRRNNGTLRASTANWRARAEWRLESTRNRQRPLLEEEKSWIFLSLYLSQSRSENLRFFDLQRKINGEWSRSRRIRRVSSNHSQQTVSLLFLFIRSVFLSLRRLEDFSVFFFLEVLGFYDIEFDSIWRLDGEFPPPFDQLTRVIFIFPSLFLFWSLFHVLPTWLGFCFCPSFWKIAEKKRIWNWDDFWRLCMRKMVALLRVLSSCDCFDSFFFFFIYLFGMCNFWNSNLI